MTETNEQMLARWDKEDAEAIRKLIAAERERCARVAENFEWGKDDDNSTLAAAIRGLKKDEINSSI